MVPWRLSRRTFECGVLGNGAYSTDGGPCSTGSLKEVLASMKLMARTVSDSEPM